MGTRDWRLRSQDLDLGLGPRREDCELTEPLITDCRYSALNETRKPEEAEGYWSSYAVFFRFLRGADDTPDMALSESKRPQAETAQEA